MHGRMKVALGLIALFAGGSFLLRRHPVHLTASKIIAPPRASHLRETAEVGAPEGRDALVRLFPNLSDKLLALNVSDEPALTLERNIGRALRSSEGAQHDYAWQTLVPALIAMDPEVAAYLADHWEAGPIRVELLHRVSREWARRDSPAALAWSASLPDTGERINTLSDVCMQISQIDPAQAIWVAEHFNIDSVGGTLENAAQLWASKDLPTALDWARHRPGGDQRNQVIARIAFIQAQTAPAEAAQLVFTEIPPGPAQDAAAISVLHQWALQAPLKAAAWVGTFPKGPLREQAIDELAGLIRG